MRTFAPHQIFAAPRIRHPARLPARKIHNPNPTPAPPPARKIHNPNPLPNPRRPGKSTIQSRPFTPAGPEIHNPNPARTPGGPENPESRSSCVGWLLLAIVVCCCRRHTGKSALRATTSEVSRARILSLSNSFVAPHLGYFDQQHGV